MSSGPHRLTPEGLRPPVPTPPRIYELLIPDRDSRSTSCFRPFSMQAANISYYILLATKFDMVASKEVARKVGLT